MHVTLATGLVCNVLAEALVLLLTFLKFLNPPNSVGSGGFDGKQIAKNTRMFV